ncbi:MAG: ATP-binding protein [Muribaculaceae bacterium]|nr:ATP-binding protein [Muribaculaceae bacterium]
MYQNKMSDPRYPIGVQNFEEIRKGGYVYVDKTGFIYELIRRTKYYFLGRPRRFGKSLLLSTIKAFFQGKRDLFEGLDISTYHDLDWDSYPVIHLDLNAESYIDSSSLDARIDLLLKEYEKQYNVVETASTLAGRFYTLIKSAHKFTGKQVVVLIDEYDKPILDTIHDDSISGLHRDKLRGFYSVLKSTDEHLKFCLLTGVTKFAHLNIFSGLNNLLDISLDDRYASICGITEKELAENFKVSIGQLAQVKGITCKETFQILKENYDGYRFSENCADIYNPHSILCCFDKKKIEPFWFHTGTPTFLINLMQNRRYELSKVDGTECEGSRMYGVDAAANDPIPVLYQSGYLSIKGYDPEYNIYTLGYPNREVKDGFISSLVPHYTGLDKDSTQFSIRHFIKEIKSGNAEAFMIRIQTLFTAIPYEMQMEKEINFQNTLYLLFTLIGLHVNVEYHTSKGRIDVLIKTNSFIYIIEIKVNSNPDIAIAQIEDIQYSMPFSIDKREIIKIGANFSTESRTLENWKVCR